MTISHSRVVIKYILNCLHDVFGMKKFPRSLMTTRYTKISDITGDINVCNVIAIIDFSTIEGNEIEIGDASASIILRLPERPNTSIAQKMGLLLDDESHPRVVMVIKNVFPIVDCNGRLLLYTSDRYTEFIKVDKSPIFSRNIAKNLSKMKFVRLTNLAKHS